MRTSSQVSVKSSVSDLVMILFLSQCSTPCQSPMPPAWNRPGHEQHSVVCLHITFQVSLLYLQAISMRMAEAVMLEGEVFQQPRMPAVKETNMKKKPTMKRAIMARIMSAKLSFKRRFHPKNMFTFL